MPNRDPTLSKLYPNHVVMHHLPGWEGVSGAMTLRVLQQCRACDTAQIYPGGIYFNKEKGYDSAGLSSAGILAGL